MLLAVESLAMCFFLVIICAIGIANGPVGAVYYYEPDVQKRVIELGLITEKKIRKGKALSALALFIPMLIFTPAMVYFINGARSFTDLFIQNAIILVAMGVFDRIFIDWYWVGKTKAWLIPGTEDLMPYIPKKTLIKKWIGMLILHPAIAALIAFILK